MAEKIYSHALTTLQRVKDRLGLTTTATDTLIGRLINGATDYIENSCNRRFLKTDYVNELYSIWGERQEYLMLKQWPVTALTKLEYRAGTPSNPSWTTFLPDQCELVEDGEAGLVRLYAGFGPLLYTNVNALRASYTAGFLIDFTNAGDTTKHSLPADLTELCERLVSKWFARREHEATKSEGIKDSQLTWADLIGPADQDTLDNYARPAKFV